MQNRPASAVDSANARAIERHYVSALARRIFQIEMCQPFPAAPEADGVPPVVGSALHDLSSDDAEQIESYAYVELNLEAAHERLNNVFMLVAVSIYMESPPDQFLVLDVLYGQILQRSKNYLTEKKDAIASMAVAHPANQVFATYSSRAEDILGGKAIPFLDELYERIRALRR